jgi:hypothetical protein
MVSTSQTAQRSKAADPWADFDPDVVGGHRRYAHMLLDEARPIRRRNLMPAIRTRAMPRRHRSARRAIQRTGGAGRKKRHRRSSSDDGGSRSGAALAEGGAL